MASEAGSVWCSIILLETSVSEECSETEKPFKCKLFRSTQETDDVWLFRECLALSCWERRQNESLQVCQPWRSVTLCSGSFHLAAMRSAICARFTLCYYPHFIWMKIDFSLPPFLSARDFRFHWEGFSFSLEKTLLCWNLFSGNV